MTKQQNYCYNFLTFAMVLCKSETIFNQVIIFLIHQPVTNAITVFNTPKQILFHSDTVITDRISACYYVCCYGNYTKTLSSTKPIKYRLVRVSVQTSKQSLQSRTRTIHEKLIRFFNKSDYPFQRHSSYRRESLPTPFLYKGAMSGKHISFKLMLFACLKS